MSNNCPLVDKLLQEAEYYESSDHPSGFWLATAAEEIKRLTAQVDRLQQLVRVLRTTKNGFTPTDRLQLEIINDIRDFAAQERWGYGVTAVNTTLDAYLKAHNLDENP